MTILNIGGIVVLMIPILAMHADGDMLTALFAFLHLSNIQRLPQITRSGLRVFTGVCLHLLMNGLRSLGQNASGGRGSGAFRIHRRRHPRNIGHQVIQPIYFQRHISPHPPADTMSTALCTGV